MSITIFSWSVIISLTFFQIKLHFHVATCNIYLTVFPSKQVFLAQVKLAVLPFFFCLSVFPRVRIGPTGWFPVSPAVFQDKVNNSYRKRHLKETKCYSSHLYQHLFVLHLFTHPNVNLALYDLFCVGWLQNPPEPNQTFSYTHVLNTVFIRSWIPSLEKLLSRCVGTYSLNIWNIQHKMMTNDNALYYKQKLTIMKIHLSLDLPTNEYEVIFATYSVNIATVG